MSPHRLLALGLAFALGVFGLEIAVHSAHHLPDRGAALPCVIAAASAHVVAAGGESPAVDCSLIAIRESRPDSDGAPLETESLAANQGRAPPPTSHSRTSDSRSLNGR